MHVKSLNGMFGMNRNTTWSDPKKENLARRQRELRICQSRESRQQRRTVATPINYKLNFNVRFNLNMTMLITNSHVPRHQVPARKITSKKDPRGKKSTRIRNYVKENKSFFWCSQTNEHEKYPRTSDETMKIISRVKIFFFEGSR